MSGVVIDLSMSVKPVTKGRLTLRQIKSALRKLDGQYPADLLEVGNGDLLTVWVDRDNNEYWIGGEDGDPADPANYGDRAEEFIAKLRDLWQEYSWHRQGNGSNWRIIAGEMPEQFDYCNPASPDHY